MAYLLLIVCYCQINACSDTDGGVCVLPSWSKVHARAGEFGGLRLGLNVVCEVSPHERGTCMLLLMRRVYCDGNSTVGGG